MASWADITSDLSGSLNNVMENALVTRAVLVFPGVRPEEVKTEDVKAGKTSSLGGFSIPSANIMQNSLNSLAGSLNDAMDGLTGLNLQLADAGFLAKSYKVQFNPSNLQIRSVGGGRFAITDYGTEKKGDTKVERTGMAPHITISFRIIIDETNNADAFMTDKFSVSASGTTQNLGTLAATAIGKKEFTVRPQVEGFLAAIRSSYHRTVVLQWGKMRYAGMLNSVQARYTMFNTSGNPIRAELDITLQAASTSSEAMLTFWKKRYADILGKLATKKKDETVSATTGNLTNTLSNLLNL